MLAIDEISKIQKSALKVYIKLHMNKNIENDIDNCADEFILHLRNVTCDFIFALGLKKFNKNKKLKKEIKSLKQELKSFAVINELIDFKILDIFNEIKISRLKIDFSMKNASDVTEDFKRLEKVFSKVLDSCFSIIEDWYFYEIFGFFSTGIYPIKFPQYNLPCEVRTACAPNGVEKEPVLDKNGNVLFVDVVRFENRKFTEKPSEWLCMTISEMPELLECEKEKCVFFDEQLIGIKNFIKNNMDAIYKHINGDIDSLEFLQMVK